MAGHSAWQKPCFEFVRPLRWGLGCLQLLPTWWPQRSTEWTSQSSNIRHQAISFSFLTMAWEIGTFGYVERTLPEPQASRVQIWKAVKEVISPWSPRIQSSTGLGYGQKGPFIWDPHFKGLCSLVLLQLPALQEKKPSRERDMSTQSLIPYSYSKNMLQELRTDPRIPYPNSPQPIFHGLEGPRVFPRSGFPR